MERRPPKTAKTAPRNPAITHPTVAALVRERTGVAWSRARQLCIDGRVTVNGERCFDPAERVRSDATIVVNETAPKQRFSALDESAIVFFDHDLVVVEKPAGMLSVADEPGNKDTLAPHTRTLLRRIGGSGEDTGLGVVQRLDRDTSGLMVFARNATAQRALAAQFRTHDVDRVYQAIAHGAVTAARIESDLIEDRGDGLRGSHGLFRRARGDVPHDAKHAVTVITPIAPLKGATLVECRLETGRQHQIRIHLSERGHPLVGERVYIRDYEGTRIESPRPMLHARVLGFAHPRTGKRVSFERDAPDDFREMLESLGGA
ncbi:RluA family pseudouridine synthase [Usitatibacter palustris]|uniref:Ribosomal large subunit pseudouridine synthase D n=1 Tax=Usitatibacter palustris TaxID=2732487 RepID=A0A6M4HAZ0_9PROT|nr:RluA family pseudouridine synthase [Usitatibacter palustris]QJR16731.1 Ribosomal large subunit pseudouridine synthase D [Usitatibacter palustris]